VMLTCFLFQGVCLFALASPEFQVLFTLKGSGFCLAE
jgi:hypothetical protein